MPIDYKLVDWSNPHHVSCVMDEMVKTLFIKAECYCYLTGKSDNPDKPQKEKTLRAEQKAKQACQLVARLKWRDNPDYTITELSEHADIRNDITGGIHYLPRTVYAWLSEVRTPTEKKTAGRPRKNLVNNDNNLQSSQ